MKDTTGLIWQNVQADSKVIGQKSVLSDGLIFFGNRYSTEENLKQAFPTLKFFKLNQVHGDSTVLAGPIQNADAHFSKRPLEALLIRTADCLPILAIDDHIALAIHAGWRGIANQIVTKAIQNSQLKNSAKFFIGPHIQWDNFEVDHATANLILAAFPQGLIQQNTAQFVRAHPHQADKVFINLASLAQEQIKNELPYSEIYCSDKSTFTESDYVSYRKEPGTNVRQWSFVARL